MFSCFTNRIKTEKHQIAIYNSKCNTKLTELPWKRYQNVITRFLGKPYKLLYNDDHTWGLGLIKSTKNDTGKKTKFSVHLKLKLRVTGALKTALARILFAISCASSMEVLLVVVSKVTTVSVGCSLPLGRHLSLQGCTRLWWIWCSG